MSQSHFSLSLATELYHPGELLPRNINLWLMLLIILRTFQYLFSPTLLDFIELNSLISGQQIVQLGSRNTISTSKLSSKPKPLCVHQFQPGLPLESLPLTRPPKSHQCPTLFLFFPGTSKTVLLSLSARRSQFSQLCFTNRSYQLFEEVVGTDCPLSFSLPCLVLIQIFRYYQVHR